jgi:hypothetical protein
MTSIAAVVAWSGDTRDSKTLESLRKCESVADLALVAASGVGSPRGFETVIDIKSFWSKSAVMAILGWFEQTSANALLWVFPGGGVFSQSGLNRLLRGVRDTDASIVYGDFFDVAEDGTVSAHPLIDYQLGSLRDDFDFGSALIINRRKLQGMAETLYEETPDLEYGAWYDLRLRLSEQGPILHLPEPIYERPGSEERTSGQKVFDYVDPGKRDYQIEMESVATDHLRRIGAALAQPKGIPKDDDAPYPVEASVVIPVKNRARTITDAVRSALFQQTSFDFNVIVVDNHSEDGTTATLAEIAREDERLVHFMPERNDLVIGGCWNEAVYSKHCGRIAVQLDSDDLYDGEDVLERIVHKVNEKPYALVIGSYTTVNFDLEPLAPGLIDHREWTDTNGHNNALRIAGLGAPRAYHVPTLRTIGFPNVSYGEDYAVVLSLSRSFPVGRIYDSLYWCRRWEENSDSALTLETFNRYAAFKDRLRTVEILARQREVAVTP